MWDFQTNFLFYPTFYRFWATIIYSWLVSYENDVKIASDLHVLIRFVILSYICYKIQDFCIPDMNTCTCPLSHLFYHTPLSQPLLEHLCIFIRITSRFFHLNAYDSNVTKGDSPRADIGVSGWYGVWYRFCHVLFSIYNIFAIKYRMFASLIWIHARALYHIHTLSHTLYHTPFWNTSIFFMQISSRLPTTPL